MVETGDKSQFNRVDPCIEDDRYRGRRRLGRHRRGTIRSNHGHLTTNQIGHQYRQPIVVTLGPDRKSTRLNSSHSQISYAVFCLKKKKETLLITTHTNIMKYTHR